MITGKEKILLVDDEPMLLDIGRQLLMLLGYRVTATADGRTALDMIKEDSKRFDLIITDQAMPDLPGTELSLEISKIDPDLPIILCTGYRNRLTEEEARHYGISSLCAKPLLVNEVSAIIRSTLARQPA